MEKLSDCDYDKRNISVVIRDIDIPLPSHDADRKYFEVSTTALATRNPWFSSVLVSLSLQTDIHGFVVQRSIFH